MGMSSESFATTSSMKSLSFEADDALRRLEDWLANVTVDVYQGKLLGQQVSHGQTPGRHVRHCLDHYFAFMTAMQHSTALDYEHRQRDVALEVCPKRALKQLERIRSACATYFIEADRAVCLAHVTDQGDAPLATTVARECVFLTQHCIHHLAIIELLVTLQGGRVPNGFGMNPSTRRHETARMSNGKAVQCAP